MGRGGGGCTWGGVAGRGAVGGGGGPAGSFTTVAVSGLEKWRSEEKRTKLNTKVFSKFCTCPRQNLHHCEDRNITMRLVTN